MINKKEMNLSSQINYIDHSIIINKKQVGKFTNYKDKVPNIN